MHLCARRTAGRSAPGAAGLEPLGDALRADRAAEVVAEDRFPQLVLAVAVARVNRRVARGTPQRAGRLAGERGDVAGAGGAGLQLAMGEPARQARWGAVRGGRGLHTGHNGVGRHDRTGASTLATKWPPAPARVGDTHPPMDLSNAAPTLANVPYGPHERNVIDFWDKRPSGSGNAAPLLVFIRGGSFRGGNRQNIDPALLHGCLDAGISVAAVNYQLSQHALYPAPMLDCARALQLIRSRAS